MSPQEGAQIQRNQVLRRRVAVSSDTPGRVLPLGDSVSGGDAMLKLALTLCKFETEFLQPREAVKIKLKWIIGVKAKSRDNHSELWLKNGAG